MIRNGNFTGRTKIERASVQIGLLNAGEADAYYSLQLDLQNYDFDDDDHVFVEAYKNTIRMRWDWGTVGNIVQPSNTTLGDFQSADWHKKWSDIDLENAITAGRGMKMPGQRLPRFELKSLVLHLRSMSSKPSGQKKTGY